MTKNLILDQDYDIQQEIQSNGKLGIKYNNKIDLSLQLLPAQLFILDKYGDPINPIIKKYYNLNTTNPEHYHPIEMILLDSILIDGTDLMITFNKITEIKTYIKVMLWVYDK
jgi:hypothetical protein